MQTLLREKTDIERYLNTLTKYFYRRYLYYYSIEEILSIVWETYNICNQNKSPNFSKPQFYGYIKKAVANKFFKLWQNKRSNSKNFATISLDTRVFNDSTNSISNHELISLDYCEFKDYSLIYEAIKKLNSKEENLIKLVYFEDKPIEEIKNIFGWSKHETLNRLGVIYRKLKLFLYKNKEDLFHD